jgi:glycosyltransferase involved in cell wall biosynthesis
VHLIALVEGRDHVCCRYRLAAFEPMFERVGHQLEYVSLSGSWWTRWKRLCGLGRAGGVIIQRKLLAPWQLYLLRRRAALLLFDFDDAVHLRDSYSTRGHSSLRRRLRFAAMIRLADAVVAGNEYLRDQARSVRETLPVQVIPTCVEPGLYPLASHVRSGKGVQVVWIGSSSTLHGLESIRPMLEEIGRQLPGLELKLICDRFFSLRHLPVLPCPWTPAREAEELAAADIGMSWLPDDPWSRGKCGLKVLQYMAAGLPVVANPVGVQADMVRDGENGFLVETPEQWSKAIGYLANNPALRRCMGRAGRRLVETTFSVAAGATRWQNLLSNLQQQRSAA